MNALITGVNLENIGSELMLRSALKRVAQMRPEMRLVGSRFLGTKNFRNKIGVSTLVEKEFTSLPWLRHALNELLRIIPDPCFTKSKYVPWTSLDYVFDVSGYQFGDPWGEAPANTMLKWCRRWREQKTKVILLPQAFGPFENSNIAASMINILSLADLIFARDKVSYQHLKSLGGCMENVAIAPDFTHIIEGEVPVDFVSDQKYICIIPNARMIDKTSRLISEAYVKLFSKIILHVAHKGLKPFVLIHSGDEDRELADQIKRASGIDFEICVEESPIYVKGIIGTCKFVIGSRYHGLINALSQGVPCIGTSWNHKYAELFKDYACSEMLCMDYVNVNHIYKLIDNLNDPDLYQSIQETICQRHEVIKGESSAMWSDISDLS